MWQIVALSLLFLGLTEACTDGSVRLVSPCTHTYTAVAVTVFMMHLILYYRQIQTFLMEQLRFASMAIGEVSAVTFGIIMMPVLYADNWDTLLMVCQIILNTTLFCYDMCRRSWICDILCQLQCTVTCYH